MTRTPTPLPAALLTTLLALSLTSGCGSSGSKAQSRMTVPQGNEAVVKTARSVLSVANKADDQPTLDLLTQRMQIHEKNAWMLRSMLEK